MSLLRWKFLERLTALTLNNVPIVATDSAMDAFGKAQGQINNRLKTTPPNVVVITASGTYTPSAGAKFAHVICIAGGGGSGGCGGSEASSGASGGNCAESWLVASTQLVTIGAGGLAGAAGNNAGSDGGTTSFGSLIVAGGGLGSGGNSHGGRVAPSLTGNVGQILYRGSPGGIAQAANFSGYGGPCGGYPRGYPLGLVANGGGIAADANSGAGAAGAMAGLLGSNAGAAGGSGICIVTEYF